MSASPPVLVLGGGISGMQVAHVLAELGVPSVLAEKTEVLGGRVPRLATTFPMFTNNDFPDGRAFVAALAHDLEQSPLVEVKLGTTLSHVEGELPAFRARFTDGTERELGAIVVATGFEPYDPTELDEYGYGRYRNVVTASELEWMLNPAGPTQGKLRRPLDGKPARRVGIVFCVGSRNRRIGAPFCSRICCSYSTKQGLSIFDRDPLALVVCFYMDVRTYDRGFEEMYSQAQERGIRYVRGRVASCKELPDGSIVVRAENTLLQEPFVGEFDLVSLSTGMRPGRDVEELARLLAIDIAKDGFLTCGTHFRHPNDSTRPGVFLAGCVTGMKPIRNSMTDGAAAAARAASVLRAALARGPGRSEACATGS